MRDSATILSWRSESGEGREDDGVAEAQRASRDGLAEGGEVVLVGATDLLDDPVQAESFEETGDLPAGLVEPRLKMAVAETADGEFPADQGEEEVEVLTVEPIEAWCLKNVTSLTVVSMRSTEPCWSYILRAAGPR